MAAVNPLSSKMQLIYNTSLDGQDAQKALLLLSPYFMGKSKDPVQDNSVDSVQEDQVVGLEGAAAANHNGQWNRRTDSSGSVDAAGHSLTAQELQIDLDDKLLKLHQEFIASFEGVYLEMKEMQDKMSLLSNDCNQIKASLDTAFANTDQVSRQLMDLKKKRMECELKAKVTTKFLARFTPSPNHLQNLSNSSTSLQITPNFFTSLSAIHDLHKDASVHLLSLPQADSDSNQGEGGQNQLGMEVINQIDGVLENAYTRLFKWTQRECRKMSHETPEIGAEFRKAMHAFRLRPILFDACIDELSHIRHEALTKSFYAALTQGGPNGAPKPIDFQAHDPQRYTGDILAWVHQACVGEREMLDAVFGLSSRADRRRASVTVPAAFEGIEGYQASIDSVLMVLDKTTQGLCNILSKRLESLFSSGHLGCLLCFKITNMSQFYADTISEVLGRKCQLSVTLFRICGVAMDAFYESLSVQSKDLLRTVPSVPASLEVSTVVRDSLLQLKEILVSHDMSLVSSGSRNPTDGGDDVVGDRKEREERFVSIILESFLEPLIQITRIGAEELGRVEGAIYLVNTFHSIQTCLMAFSAYKVIEHKVQQVSDEIAAQVKILVEEQYQSLLFMSGFSGIVSSLSRKPKNEPMSLFEPSILSPAAIKTSMQLLNTFLQNEGGVASPSHPDGSLNLSSGSGVYAMDVVEKLYKIQSVDVSRRVAAHGRSLFLDAYAMVVQEIMDPANKYEFPASLITRSVEEMNVLLGGPN